MKEARYKWTVVDDVIIAVGTEGAMPEEPWKNFVREVATKTAIRKYFAQIIGAIEVSSVQRKMIIDVVVPRKIKVVAVTDSSVVRGIITVAAWFGVDISSFHPAQVRDAVHELGLSRQQEIEVVSALDKLKESVL